MKKFLLPLILVIGFIFAGFEKAEATLTIGPTAYTPTTISLTSASGATNAEQIISFSVTSTGNTDDIFYGFTFTSTNPPGTNFTNFKLLVNSSNTITGAVNDNATFTGTGTNTITVQTPETLNNGQGLPYDETDVGFGGTNLYYFIVADYTASATETFQVSLTTSYFQTYSNYFGSGATSSKVQTVPGNTFICTPPAAAPGIVASNISSTYLTASTVFVGQSNIAAAGTEITTNTVATSGTVTSLSFTYTGTNPLSYFTLSGSTGPKVYYKTTAPSGAFTYSGGTAVTPTYSVSGSTVTLSFPAVTVSYSQPVYFYVLLNYNVIGGSTPSGTFTFSSSGYTATYAGGAATAFTTSYAANSFVCTTPTYYWTGGGGDGKWETTTNWEVGTGGTYYLTTGNGYYPGDIYSTLGKTGSTPDPVDISPSVTSPVISLSTTLSIASLYNEPGVSASLNINSAITLTTSSLTVGNNAGSGAAATMTLTGSGTMAVTGTTNLYYASNLLSNAGALNFAGTINLYGTGTSSTNGSSLKANGGTITVTNNIYYYGAYDYVQASAGILNLNNSTVYLGYGLIFYGGSPYGLNNYLNVSGGTINNNASAIYFYGQYNYINITSGAFNVSPSSAIILGYGGYIYNQINVSSGATLALTGTSGSETSTVIEVGDADYDANSWITNNGTFNITSAEVIAYGDAIINSSSGTLSGSDAVIHLDNEGGGFALIQNSGSFSLSSASQLDFYYSGSTVTNTGTMNLNSSTVNFGITAALNFGNGNSFTPTACTLNNTAGVFNLGASSKINFNVTSSNTLAKASTINNSGSGTFTCASTSMINFVQSYAIINQTSSNPFTLLSDASGSATVGGMNLTVGGTTYTGDAMTATAASAQYNVQRYISAASRNYRLLASQVNETSSTTPGTTGTPDVVNISALGYDNPASPAPGFKGAFIAGPGAGFTNSNANPVMYLYQESLLPGSSENLSFTSGKNVGIININTASPYGVSTKSTSAGGQTGPDNNNSNGVLIPAGNGYLLYYIHDNTTTNTSGPLTTATTTATGYINQGAAIPFILWGTTGALTTAMTLTPATTAGQLYPGYFR